MLAPATVVLTPAENQIVPLDGLVVTWAAVPGAVSYIVEVDNEDRGNAILAAVAVRMADGNVTSVENTFTTVDE